MPQNSHDPLDPNRKNLPWPEETDPSGLGERFEHAGSHADRELAGSFERSNEADNRELGSEFSDPHYAENHKLAASFADPNSKDDGRLGRSFEESESSRKKPPLKDRVHLPHAPRDPRSRRVFWIVLAVAAVVFLLALLVGWLPRHRTDKQNEEAARNRRTAKPVIEVAKVMRSTNSAGLILPGTTLPLTEAFVYARANGYLTKRLVDIGDHVHKGQLLAIIDAPELDAQVSQAVQQLRQSQQQLEQQRAQLALATVTVNRYRVLVAKGVFSRQDGDVQETNYGSQLSLVAASQRNVDAFQANLRRVQALQSYEFVRAPFTGIVTQRNVDVGALISGAGGSSGDSGAPAPMGQVSTTGGTAQAGAANVGGTSGSTSSAATVSQSPGQGGALFGISQNDRLRILVSVPEGYVTSIHVGVPAQLSFQEFPDQQFIGKVTRTANSVDPNTRTMLTEVQLDNHNGKLVPGMYVVATFGPTPGAQSPLLISGDAIAVRNDQTTVAKVVNGKIQMVPVTLGRDLGAAVEVTGGVQEGDLIATNITDDVRDGAEITVSMVKSPVDQPAQVQQQTQAGRQHTIRRPGHDGRQLAGQAGPGESAVAVRVIHPAATPSPAPARANHELEKQRVLSRLAKKT